MILRSSEERSIHRVTRKLILSRLSSDHTFVFSYDQANRESKGIHHCLELDSNVRRRSELFSVHSTRLLSFGSVYWMDWPMEHRRDKDIRSYLRARVLKMSIMCFIDRVVHRLGAPRWVLARMFQTSITVEHFSDQIEFRRVLKLLQTSNTIENFGGRPECIPLGDGFPVGSTCIPVQDFRRRSDHRCIIQLAWKVLIQFS